MYEGSQSSKKSTTTSYNHFRFHSLTSLNKKTRNIISNFSSINSLTLSKIIALEKINNYHKDCLREKVHNLKSYQYLFLTSKTVQPSEENNRIHHYSMSHSSLPSNVNHNNSQNKESLFNLFKKKNPNIIKNSKGSPFPNIEISYGQRAETLSQFQNKTQNIIREKYKYCIQNNTYQTAILDKQNTIELIENRINNLKKTSSFFNDYLKEKDEYHKFLIKNLFEETEKNEDYKQKKTQLMSDIQKLKMKKEALLKRLYDNIKLKHLLIFLKNNSTDITHIKLEDQREFQYDNQFLSRIINKINGDKRTKEPTKKLSKRLNSFLQRKTSFLLLSKKRNYNNSNSPNSLKTRESLMMRYTQENPIFSSPEEFDSHMQLFKDKVLILIEESNEKKEEIKQMRNEYNEIKQTGENSKFDNFTEEIKELEIKLDILKEKNKELLNYHNLYQDKKNKLKKTHLKIYSLFNKINQIFPLRIEENYKTKIFSYLKAIEEGIINMLNIIDEYKRNIPEKYKEFEKEKEKRNKVIQAEIRKQNQQKQFDIKFKKVFENQTKITYNTNRKTEPHFYSKYKMQLMDEREKKLNVKTKDENDFEYYKYI